MRASIVTRRTPLLAIAGLIVAVLAVIGALLLVMAQARASDWVQHSLDVQVKLNHLSETVRQAESDTRGFLLTGKPRFYDSMESAIRAAPPALDAIAKEVADNPVQMDHMVQLRALLDERFASLHKSADFFARTQTIPQGDPNSRDYGPEQMRRVTDVIGAMLTEEERLQAERRTSTDRLILALGSSLALIVLLVVAVAAVVLRDARRREDELTRMRDTAIAASEGLRDQMAAREAAEAQTRQLQKMESIGQLTGGIAHDFNNMLAIVIGSLDLAKRKIGGDPEVLTRYISNASEGAERAASLTARLLAFSRQQPLAPVTIDVNKLVQGMSELLRRTMGEQYMVETVLAGGLWRAFADPGQLENSVLNLAVNARDAMADGGHVTIETANAYLDDEYARIHSEVAPGQYVMISVTDTGTGMTPEVIAKAFDPFFTTKAVGKGTGLGLSQIFGFTKQTGGHCAIYSEPGQGTTVKLYMPRHMGEPTMRTNTLVPETELPQGKSGEVVLVVEDEQRVRHFSVDALRELGYTVISAASGAEALVALGEQPQITMLFTDIVMPEMNGRKLADAALALRPDLKVLFTTGYTRNAVVHNGMLDAGVAFLPKPFTVSQLATKVREVMDGGGANRPV
ncbi:CHASE3 domain-containing protein [Sphingomonas crocodyli]|uniref:histidine kinase n=1 Tax=Sphingomonas crocodyli TaxID=1979270 RepID=A0A437MAN2_9SPHN|nr:CHASE3 domain-containing protein [Sphingomonas crocodyli]RVT94709.1 response regulator [Sphingomonas crocodyli]